MPYSRNIRCLGVIAQWALIKRKVWIIEIHYNTVIISTGVLIMEKNKYHVSFALTDMKLKDYIINFAYLGETLITVLVD